jgi:hypothetical protein
LKHDHFTNTCSGQRTDEQKDKKETGSFGNRKQTVSKNGFRLKSKNVASRFSHRAHRLCKRSVLVLPGGCDRVSVRVVVVERFDRRTVWITERKRCMRLISFLKLSFVCPEPVLVK